MSDLTNTFRVSGLIAAFAFLICLFAAQNAQAQLTLTVTRTDDRNTTCVTGDCSLREAVNAANAVATDDTINFAIPAGDAGCTSGVCTITLTFGEIAVTSAVTAGTLTITNSTGASNLLISGNDTSRAFFVNTGANLTISGVTITKGNGTGTTNPDFNGNGGGIVNNGGALTLTHSTVSNNMATNGSGGGIVNNGILTLTVSTVSGNSADGGGGIYNSGNGTLTLTHSTVSGNMATFFGGGILNFSTTTLTNSTINGNTATQSGSGIYNGSGILTLTVSTVSGNTATFSGGISNNGGTTTLTNSIVSGNTATNGSGIFNYLGTTTLTNSTLSSNTASFDGGIVNTSTLNLTSVTVTQNKSTNASCTTCAGGINNFATANLKNTIVAANTVANASSSPDFRGAVAATSSFNLIGNSLGTTGISNADANSNQVGVDPKLDPTLKLNGGTTPSHALLFGSPALDKGNSFTLTTDQRGTGFARPVPLDDATYPNATGGDGADIGAYEAQTAPAVTTAATVSVSGRVLTMDGRGIVNVRLSLTDSNGEVRTATDTSFGFYHFDAVKAGETYILSAAGKRYTFSQPVRVLNINEETDAVNFIADSK